jgi:hypothetical protein
MLAQSGDSKAVRKLSRSVPKVPSFRRMAAVIRDASGPPPGCFTFRSCKMETAHMRTINRFKRGEEAKSRTCMRLRLSLARSLAAS